MSGQAPTPPQYFEARYGHSPDPWDYESSAYEDAKYAATLAALPQAHYADALEIGCSIGVLTERLAARCSRLLAVDMNQTALERARRRCAHLPGVRTARLQLPDEQPDGSFDLILLSEVGYYWSRADLERAAGWMLERLNGGATLALVHWTGPVPEHPITGDAVHDAVASLAAARGAAHVLGQRSADYRLDVYTAGPGQAARSG